MLYVIHRLNREEIPGDETLSLPPMIGIKVFPLRDTHGDYHTVEAGSPESAFGVVKLLWPHLSHSLCVQPLSEYQNDLARFAEYKAARLASGEPPRAKPRRILPRSAAVSARD